MPKMEKLPSIHGVKDPLLRRILRWVMQRVVEPVVPVGATMAWFGNKDTIPPSWVPMDGRALDQGQFADLFAVLGYRYGGSLSDRRFFVPDARGRWIFGVPSEQIDAISTGFGTPALGQRFGYFSLTPWTITGPPAGSNVSPYEAATNFPVWPTFMIKEPGASVSALKIEYAPASITAIWIIKALSGQESVAGAGRRQFGPGSPVPPGGGPPGGGPPGGGPL